MIKVLIIIFMIVAIFMYLIILGANKDKTDADLDDEVREEYEKWKDMKRGEEENGRKVK